MSKYAIHTHWGETYEFDADLSQASAPIHAITEDGELSSTPFQTADARHDADEAALLLMAWWGRDTWLSPDCEVTESESGEELYDGMTQDEYIASLISVESIED